MEPLLILQSTPQIRANMRSTKSRHCPLPLHRKYLLLQLARDRKSTRLNSSHAWRAYAVFCSKKKSRLRLRPLRIQLVFSSHLLGLDDNLRSYNLGLCLFFNVTATTEIYTLSLHDALPI